MKKKHQRRLALLTALAALGVLVAWCVVQREAILVRWHILRLRSGSPEARLQAIDALERHGSPVAVPALVAVARDREDSRARALGALEKLLPDAAPENQKPAAEVLLRLAAPQLAKRELTDPRWRVQVQLTPDGPLDALQVLRNVGPRMPGALDVFERELRSPHSPAFFLSARILAAAWAGSPAGDPPSSLEQRLLRVGPDGIVAFFREVSAEKGFRYVAAASPAASSPPPPDRARALAAWLARAHPDPSSGAAALGWAAYESRETGDMGLLREFSGKETPLLLRRAAIRLQGYLGKQFGAVDLGALLVEGDDPELLPDIIHARRLWTEKWRKADGIDLGCGVACDWFPRPASPPEGVPWRKEELERIEAILRTEKDAPTRDAASAALAARFRPTSAGVHKPPPETPFLDVREWGVWRDGGDFLTVARQAIQELPSFVHRTTLSAEAVARDRSYMPMLVTKPVVFFRVREPVSILVRVRFFEGRPWTCYPRVTDYLETTRTVSTASRGQSTPPPFFAPAAGFRDRPGLSPPWRLSGIPGGLHESVPWLVPPHPPFGRLTGPGEVELAGIGMEWCGLRVGYPEEVEPALPAAEEGSWWRHLREVPSASVALGAERERFLFYDGAANVPAPVVPAWDGEKREALQLTARSAEEYPKQDWLPWWERDDPEESRAGPTVPAAFVIRKRDGGPARGAVARRLSAKEPPARVHVDALDFQGEALVSALRAELQAQGLSEAEAESLVKTWHQELFDAPGLRVLTLLPRWLYDAAVPITIYPKPTSLVRVGLVLRECDDL